MPRRPEHSVLSFRSPLLEMKGVGNDGIPGIAHAHVVILQTNTIYPSEDSRSGYSSTVDYYVTALHFCEYEFLLHGF